MKKKTIGELTKTRIILGSNMIGKVKEGKKGKGSYNRQKWKRGDDID